MSTASPKGGNSGAPRQNLFVLLVEDNPDVADLTALQLEQRGFTVITARDGQQALKILEVATPHVVVTDMMMPVMDGFAFIAEYKVRGYRMPVIAVSALDDYVDTALRVGADAALRKPYPIKELAAQIRALARRERPNAPGPAAQPPDESARLRTIVGLQLDEPAPEGALQDFIDRVAAHFGVAVALVSVITQDRQYWTVGSGIPSDLPQGRGSPRSYSFCTHAVVARAALVVQDAQENPFFRDNMFVTQYGVRFYAGVPLIYRHGEVVGTLCLLDYRPRTFTHADLELLGVFGRCVLAALERRDKERAPAVPEAAFRHLHYLDPELDIFGAAAFYELAVVEDARSSEQRAVVSCVVLALPARRLAEAVVQLRARSSVGLIGRLGHARLGWLVRGLSPENARQAALEAGGKHAFAAAVQLGRGPIAVRSIIYDLELALGDAGLM